jgi:hypothetical protein
MLVSYRKVPRSKESSVKSDDHLPARPPLHKAITDTSALPAKPSELPSYETHEGDTDVMMTRLNFRRLSSIAIVISSQSGYFAVLVAELTRMPLSQLAFLIFTTHSARSLPAPRQAQSLAHLARRAMRGPHRQAQVLWRVMV